VLETGRPRNVGAKLLVVGVFVVVAGGSALVGRLPDPLDSSLLATGTEAPDFLLKDVQGRPVRLSSFRGRAVVLNFMASWCGPCQAELPVLQKASQDFADGALAVLAVNVGEQTPRVAVFVRERGIPYPVLVDDDERVARQYAVSVYPTNYFIDAAGIVRAAETGAFEDSPQGRSIFDWRLRSSLGESLAAARRERSACRQTTDPDPVAHRGSEVTFQLWKTACACGCSIPLRDCRCEGERGGQAMLAYLDRFLEDPDFTVQQAVGITAAKFRAHAR